MVMAVFCFVVHDAFCFENSDYVIFNVLGGTLGNFQDALDIYRFEGVRRDNVVKNTGRQYYAFNAFQV